MLQKEGDINPFYFLLHLTLKDPCCLFSPGFSWTEVTDTESSSLVIDVFVSGVSED